MRHLPMIIVAVVAISVFIVTLIPDKMVAKSSPCHNSGVTIIEYGVGVTNCGDTIPVKMPGELYKEFKEAN